jgi:hypothetical protein
LGVIAAHPRKPAAVSPHLPAAGDLDRPQPFACANWLQKAESCWTAIGTWTIACQFTWVTVAEFDDDVVPPPTFELLIDASPPLPPLPASMLAPPPEDVFDPLPDAAAALPLSAFVGEPPFALLPPLDGVPDVADPPVPEAPDAPPDAVAVFVLVAVPPLAFCWLEFEPAPPVSVTEVLL